MNIKTTPFEGGFQMVISPDRPKPEPKPETIYEEHGYTDRQDYLECLADDYGVDFATVSALADMLGRNEDFDGLVTELQDNF